MTDIVDALTQALSGGAVITGEDLAQRNNQGVIPKALLRPNSTDEVIKIMQICHENNQKVVPQGGLTGLVNGADTRADEIAISLERMNKIEEIDVASRTMTVQAGVPLQTVQEAAERDGLIFPLDLGARGTATIGGNVSTNAGGNRVIRYGMMREQILGMEVVLANGTLITSMNKIIKNNTGYDLKHLFIGAEGTLGIVTRLVLRVRPAPVSQELAFIAVNSFQEVIAFLNYVDRSLGGTLSAFEVLWQDFYKLVTTAPAEGKPPLGQEYNYYILLESLGGDIEADSKRFITTLGQALEDGMITDAVIAQSQSDREAMWAIRDDVLQLGQNYPIFTFDISVSLDKMESYVSELKQTLAQRWPEHTCMIFGHLGDGNLHIIVGVGDGTEAAKHAVEEVVYQGLVNRGGSVSAEHGIGLQKKSYLSWSRSEPELEVMSLIKKALDPKGILNSGKVLSDS
ncbi:MAG: FAD-binding oxidoreductase [Gammaproteobacteria bacterium]|nr:FAD-binding oxidoreductase [Gammaproteobacteria bacterium]